MKLLHHQVKKAGARRNIADLQLLLDIAHNSAISITRVVVGEPTDGAGRGPVTGIERGGYYPLPVQWIQAEPSRSGVDECWTTFVLTPGL
ncbi:MAG: hypothetical protein V3U65_14175 [Granulosicoccaceae bacterium]